MLAASAYSLAGLALPQGNWWDSTYERARDRSSATSGTVAAADVTSVREMMTFFSQRDQRRGGADGRDALVAYLRTDVAAHLSRRTPSEGVRRDLFSAAAELTYLAGWTAFDTSAHALAQRYFMLAVRLAAEAGDAPLTGHVLRAMAHQAVDLHHPQQALDLATASVERQRYTLASPREKALLGVVHARALAAAGHKKDALTALLRAEDDLGKADDGTAEEPGRVFFFGQASLAHETACTLRDLGDLNAAEQQFKLSVRTRRKQTFRRTHSVTLGYLGAVQAQQGAIDAACTTWTKALDAMDGVQSGRARETVVQMRRASSPFRGRGGHAATALDDRAQAVLRNVG